MKNENRNELGLILIVDDTEANRYFFSHHLSDAGYQVLEAKNGQEALELVEQQEPDIILLDVNLPDMNGLTVCAKLKNDSHLGRIPIIQTSANYTKAHDHFIGIECGADSYISTPIDPLILLSTVKTWLRVRRADQSLTSNLELLEEEQELRERFVSTLSHDLRTPLTAARLAGEMLGRKLGSDSPHQVMIEHVINNIDRVDSMIRDLLDANLIKAGEKLPLNIEKSQLNQIIQKVIDEMVTVHGKRFDFKPSMATEGFWDKTALRRILENLLNNAVKYGSPNTTINLSIEQSEPGFVSIQVHNVGNPITETDLKNLFNPYKRVRSNTNQKVRGWGLGLSLVKGLVESHGGKVSVHSSINQGTTFSFTLPLNRSLQDESVLESLQ